VGAVLAGASPTVEAALTEFGSHLGTAFQLVDDVLDYSGDLNEIGKNLGDDLAEGKPTLPLIRAMRGRDDGRSGASSATRSSKAGATTWTASWPPCSAPARSTTRATARGARRRRPRNAFRAFRIPPPRTVCYNWLTFRSNGSSSVDRIVSTGADAGARFVLGV
jgi:octaprenyl-diphosphate synthase